MREAAKIKDEMKELGELDNDSIKRWKKEA